MYKNLDIDEVADGLWVGSYPSTPEFVTTLTQDLGITAIVSVQTDDDLAVLGLNWPAMERFIQAQGIELARVPIRDFDDRSLERGLTEAAQTVHFFRSLDRPTYLHCTAGLNRSPSVAIAYLVAHQDMDLDEALDQVTERRRSMPVSKVLKRWHKRFKKGRDR